VRIEAYHANIKDDEFNVAWFKSFGLVFNALDNLEARRHVNKMCLAADIPLIESGTTGFNGQVQVIRKVGAPLCIWSHSGTDSHVGPIAMLRLHTESHAQVLPSLHDPKHSIAADSLHRVGQVLPLYRDFWHIRR
jgi:hypothetical protein